MEERGLLTSCLLLVPGKASRQSPGAWYEGWIGKKIQLTSLIILFSCDLLFTLKNSGNRLVSSLASSNEKTLPLSASLTPVSQTVTFQRSPVVMQVCIYQLYSKINRQPCFFIYKADIHFTVCNSVTYEKNVFKVTLKLCLLFFFSLNWCRVAFWLFIFSYMFMGFRASLSHTELQIPCMASTSGKPMR